MSSTFEVLLWEFEQSQASGVALWNERVEYGKLRGVWEIVLYHHDSKLVKEADLRAPLEQSTSFRVRMIKHLGSCHEESINAATVFLPILQFSSPIKPPRTPLDHPAGLNTGGKHTT